MIEHLTSNKEFEFQKLQGMGNILYNKIVENHKVRIYAPVGDFNDLLAYLMRRLLENGANSSFVNKVLAESKDNLIFNLYEKCKNLLDQNSSIVKPKDIYPNRVNSLGVDLGNLVSINNIRKELKKYGSYRAGSIIGGEEIIDELKDVMQPADNKIKIGQISLLKETYITKSLTIAQNNSWSLLPVSKRSEILKKIADLYEESKIEIYSILIREAGKSLEDAIAEVREAIDFCRYYANIAVELMQEKELPGPTGERNLLTLHERGVFVCISPWNFPFAIFTGQIVAALVTGNNVIAKPAMQTSIIANFAVKLMHKAGVTDTALQLIIASGRDINKYVIENDIISGVAFTGSNETARVINKTLAERKCAIAPLIAETGGQNAMIVDSSSLLEQVTDDVLASSFYSAGQRCSALRVLYIQEEIFDNLIEMISGAIDTLKVGNTEYISNDIGPVIDLASKKALEDHVENMKLRGFKIIAKHKNNNQNEEGYYFYPHIIKINSIHDIEGEKFGPILHVISYKSSNLDKIIEEINSYGYGLTFGMHSRIESRIEYIRSRIKVGNIYANRSMIGAVVESQPFGGQGLSGTGFKAGGPHYLLRFITERSTSINLTAIGGNIDLLRQ